jgi:hypothetical protein
MRLPVVTLEVDLSGLGFTTDLCRGIALKCSVKTAAIVTILECFKLPLQINRIPEQRLVRKLTTNGPNQALDEGGDIGE